MTSTVAECAVVGMGLLVLLKTCGLGNHLHHELYDNDAFPPQLNETSIAPQVPHESNEEDEECRICFENGQVQPLVQPCNCTGTMKYVHRACVDRMRRQTNAYKCTICLGPYHLKYSPWWATLADFSISRLTEMIAFFIMPRAIWEKDVMTGGICAVVLAVAALFAIYFLDLYHSTVADSPMSKWHVSWDAIVAHSLVAELGMAGILYLETLTWAVDFSRVVPEAGRVSMCFSISGFAEYLFGARIDRVWQEMDVEGPTLAIMLGIFLMLVVKVD